MQTNKILSLVLGLACSVAQAKKLVDRVMAVVGDEPVLQSEVDEFKSELEKSPALANIYHLDAKTLTADAVLKKMIEEKIVHFAVKELDMPVSETEVDTQIAGIAKQNNMPIATLQESLKREGVPYDVYRRNIRAQLERRNIFDRELRRGGGVTENELRTIYEERSKSEANISLIEGRSVKELKATRKEILTHKLSPADIEKKYATESLGWVSPDSLDERVAALLKPANPGDVIGPVKIAGKQNLVLLYGRRKGSEDEFQKTKSDLTQEAQSSDYERRFANWLERKKTEMHILINPL